MRIAKDENKGVVLDIWLEPQNTLQKQGSAPRAQSTYRGQLRSVRLNKVATDKREASKKEAWRVMNKVMAGAPLTEEEKKSSFFY